MRNLTIRIDTDSGVDNPLDDSGFKLHSFSRRHSNFLHPDKLGFSAPMMRGAEPGRSKKLQKMLDDKKAWICSYYEHGRSAWFLYPNQPVGVEFQWDGVSVAGLLVCELSAKDRKHYKDLDQTAASLLEEYTTWCNGDYVWCSITDSDTDKEIDSCSGIEDINAYLKEHVALLADAEITYEGELDSLGKPAVDSLLREYRKSLVPA